MRISDWSSDVCSSDLVFDRDRCIQERGDRVGDGEQIARRDPLERLRLRVSDVLLGQKRPKQCGQLRPRRAKSEEHTSKLQSLMRISYAVFCLKKKHKLTISTLRRIQSLY